MNRPTVQVINVQTGENIIREMNDEEYAQHLKDQAAAEDAAKEPPTE